MGITREPKVVFLTGAGLSADSGLPTYRGEGGIYHGRRIEEFLTPETLRNDPETLHSIVDDLRVSLRNVEPNAAHMMIARLECLYGRNRVLVFTQNVDDLLSRAGVAEPFHLHGVLRRMRSIGNSKIVEDIGYTRYWEGDPSLAPARGFRFRCPKTGSHFRPDVVLFNEIAKEYSRLYRALRSLRRDDIFVVIGTNGDILPVAAYASAAPCMTVLNNLHESDHIDESVFDAVLRDRAAVVAEEVERLVVDRLGVPGPASRCHSAGVAT